MNDSLCKQVQNIVNQALRAIMGHKRGDMAQPCAAMWRELDVPPVCAMAGARRARAIRKFPAWIEDMDWYPGTICSSEPEAGMDGEITGMVEAELSG